MQDVERTQVGPIVLNLLPLIILVGVLPGGVGLQNAGAIVFLGFALIHTQKLRALGSEVWRRFKWPLIFGGTFLFLGLIASLLNPQSPAERPGSFLFGYAGWVLLPCLVYALYQPLAESHRRALTRTAVVVAAIWAAIVLSQYLVGWRLLGSMPVPDVSRPRGFYSHPLTLAYVGILIWPAAVQWLLSRLRSRGAWLVFGCATMIILFTLSRTVQVVAMAVLVWNIMRLFSGRVRQTALAAAVVGGCALLVTDNIVGTKLRQTFSEQGVDKFSPYPDDRLAFWHAHWEMFKDRPLLGHGMDLDTEYRTPYYERIGLKDFVKKYEAHNMFLQILVNAGLLGLAAFLAWFASILIYVHRHVASPFMRNVGVQTIFAFLMAGLTQNAFQDGEVRYTLSLLVAILWLFDQRDGAVK